MIVFLFSLLKNIINIFQNSREEKKLQANKDHHEERKKLRRSASGLKSKRKGNDGFG